MKLHRRSDLPDFLASAALVLGVAVLAVLTVAENSRPLKRRADAAAGRAFGEPRSSEESLATQKSRAEERGRGRRAQSVFGIPWRGWKDVFYRTYTQIVADRLLAVAAGVVFYGLLALFPAITALVSSYGLFTDPATISSQLRLLSDLMPPQGYDLVQEQIARIVGRGSQSLSLTFAFGLGLALWSANAGMKAMIDALNVIYDEKERRGFFKLNLVSLAFTVGTLVVMLASFGSIVVLPLILSFVGLGTFGEFLAQALRWPALLLVILLGLSILYRFGPNRRSARWQWVSVGSVVATAAWLAGSALLSYYLANFADYDATYGSLGAGIGLMMWLWLTSIVILLGAELNSEIEHQTSRDTTVGADKPLGSRGATMADTVGRSAG